MYIEFRGDTPKAVKDSILGLPGFTGIAPYDPNRNVYDGRPGVMAETDPALGLDVLRLAEELMRSPFIVTADVQLIDFSFPPSLD
jgi:hypothetical protein